MSSPTPTGAPVPPESTPAAQGVDPAAAAASGQKPGGQPSSKAAFTSMDDFRIHEPEIYDEMMKGIASQIISNLRRHTDRLKKLIREGQQRK